MPFLEMRGASKAYGQGRGRVEVLTDVNLAVEEGEFVAVLGFSGSGKTTLLSLIAGLIRPDSGQVLLQGKPIEGPGPDRGVVFQNYSLLPWLTVEGNVALAVDQVFASSPAEERRARVEKYLAMVNLTAAKHKRPIELSGGMRQRVSVARALAMEPKMLLLDEPLGALDALTRGTLQAEIGRICGSQGRTVVLITNDIDEAILLADRIVPLEPGPRATLGPDFKVSIPRPRDKKALNDDPHYKRIRNDVTGYLLDARRRRRGGPQVVPVPAAAGTMARAGGADA